MSQRNLDAMVVGVGRSGTTLLASMMQASHDIHVLPETQILRRIFVNEASRLLQSPSEVLAADKNLIEYEVPISRISERLPSTPSGAEIYQTYVSVMAEGHEGIVVEKNPTAIDYLPLLRDMFPEIKVVHIRRAAPDVVESRMKAGWSKDRNPRWHLVAYKSQIAAAERDRLANPALHHVVTYEDLVKDTEGVCEGICNFLGYGIPHAMVNYSNLGSDTVTKSATWHHNVGKPISSSSVRGGSGLPAELRDTALAVEQGMLNLRTLPISAGSFFHDVLRRGQTARARRVLA